MRDGIRAIRAVAAVAAVLVVASCGLLPEAKPTSRSEVGTSSAVGTTSLDNLAAGDCFDSGDFRTGVTSLGLVSCDEPHDSEITAVTGAPVTDDYSLRRCTKSTADYVGAGWAVDPELLTNAVMVTGTLGRRLVCFVTSIDTNGTLTRSVEGTKPVDPYRDADGVVTQAAPVLLDGAEVGDCLTAADLPDDLRPETTFTRVPCSQPHDSEVVSVRDKSLISSGSFECDGDLVSYVGPQPPVTVVNNSWTMNRGRSRLDRWQRGGWWAARRSGPQARGRARGEPADLERPPHRPGLTGTRGRCGLAAPPA